MSCYLKPAVMLLLSLTLLTGVAYPLAITVLAQTLFPDQANGSLLKDKQGQALGSQLIGQPFSADQYFWGRPSATSSYPNNAAASSGSNPGPTNPALVEAVAIRVKALRQADPGNKAAVPVDLVTASASGLDPQISLAEANYQLDRVAKARQMGLPELRTLVAEHTEQRQWRLFGEPRVNVLQLNLALDASHR